MKKADRKKLEEKLMERRDGLTRNAQDTALNSTDPVDDGQDTIDFATRSYTKEFLLSLSNLERRQLQMVEAALERVCTSDYGLCTSCDEEISRKRLTAAPWVEYCLECQEEEERNASRAGRSFTMLEEEPDLGE
jgi:RNA polymerase-binding transcription factor